MPEAKKPDQKVDERQEAEPVSGKALTSAAASSDGAIQQLLALRDSLAANGLQDKADEVTARLAELGYR